MPHVNRSVSLHARRAPGLRLATMGFALLGALAAPSLAGVGRPAEAPAPVTAPTEEHVLRQLCRYLRLSRTQVGYLLPAARHTERARGLLSRQEADLLRRLPALENRPAEAERLRQLLEERRARINAEIVQFATPQVVRLLTREQVALAWRLLQGRPPAYAAADPSLLNPAAGIVPAPLLIKGTRLLSEHGAPAGAEIEFATTVTPHEGLRLQELSTLSLGRRLTLTEPQVTAAPDRPFPQLVVETNDLRDLVPAVEPLVRRAFLSEQWVSVLEDAWARGLDVKPSRNHRLMARPALRLVRNYDMAKGFRDLTGRGPALETLGGSVEHGMYLFGPGQGLRLGDTGVRDEYQVEFSFRYFGGESYRKLLDFKKGTQDGGLYAYQGHITFYTLANGGVPEPGREHRLRLERDRETRIVRGYLDLRPVFQFIDLDDEAVFADGVGMLFVDDATTQGEQGPGGLRWVNVRGPAANRFE